MFNPFALFTEPLLEAFLAKGKRYFVRQTFKRGLSLTDEANKGSYIICHYSTLEEATAHFNLLAWDAHRFLYDSTIPEHLEKLIKAAKGIEGYRIFASVAMPNWEARADVVLKKKVKTYIDHKIKWRPGRNATVDFDLYIHLGEVYAKLQLKNQVVKVRLEEIENFK